MNTWQTILDDYLDGRATREQVESLARRIDLDASARAQVRELIAVADAVAQVCDAMDAPETAPESLLQALMDDAAAEDRTPGDAANAGLALEEAIDRYIDGGTLPGELRARVEAVGVDEATRDEAQAVLTLTQGVEAAAGGVPATQAPESLLAKLRDEPLEDAPDADEALTLDDGPADVYSPGPDYFKHPAKPDVLAAGNGDEDDEPDDD